MARRRHDAWPETIAVRAGRRRIGVSSRLIMMRRTRIRLASLLALLLIAGMGVFFFTRPAAAVAGIEQAIADKRYADLNALVDFPALRASVKADLVRQLESRTGLSPDAGALVGSILIGPVVDLVVSPVGLDLVLDGYSVRETAQDARPAPDARQAGRPQVRREAAWRSLSRYDVTVFRDDQPVSTLTLRRHGLFGWKLAGLNLAP